MSRSAIYTLIIYLLILLGVWFIVLPMFNDNQSLRASVERLNSEVVVEEEALAEIERQAEVLLEKEKELSEVELALPSERELSSIIAIFEEASASNGLILSSLNISEIQEDPREKSRSLLKTLTVDIDITGRYSAFESFLKDIEKSFPIMDVSKISFNTFKSVSSEDADALNNPVIEFSISIETYYQAN